MHTRLVVILGSHLFDPVHLKGLEGSRVFMAEDLGLCTEIRHHQQKIVLFLSAMRSYRDVLFKRGFEVEYHELAGPTGELTYEERLWGAVERLGIQELVHFEIEDRPFAARMAAFAESRGLRRRVLDSPMFLTRIREFEGFQGSRKRLHMADFYRWQRERLSILVGPDGEPAGGRWSFDTENRERLDDLTPIPGDPAHERTAHERDVIRLVEERFSGHPGRAAEFSWPTTHTGARAWLEHFIEHRLKLFGPYEDAISTRTEVAFHSRLTPMLNCGLLTPREVVDRVLGHQDSAPIASLEGFIRQVIGWREFIRCVDATVGEVQHERNAFGHTRRLAPCWWDATTGIPPLDDMIQTAIRRGWTHHILRLMVAGNIMTLTGVVPREALRWFTEMYVDSAHWVMGPNVLGMGICSDGGVFATKPYICGSNYILKMSDYKKGPWCDELDGLYWGFIERHRAALIRNPRMATVVRSLDRLGAERRERILAAGERARRRLTVAE